jgi:hypothetical protein
MLSRDVSSKQTVTVNGGVSSMSEGKQQDNSNAEMEEEIKRKYRERKMRAKKKKELAQQELQRLADEKRQMEDDLEDLRVSVSSVAAAQQQQQQQQVATTVVADNEQAETDGQQLAKLRRKYEKKLQVAREEHEDMREVIFKLC